MNLEKKKLLAARTFGVGKERISFNTQRLDEVKEAITKQDIRDLVAAGAITIKQIKGRKAIVKRESRRGPGKVRRKVGNKKAKYVLKTRNFRAYLAGLRSKGQINEDHYQKLRREVRASAFRDLAQLKEKLQEMKE